MDKPRIGIDRIGPSTDIKQAVYALASRLLETEMDHFISVTADLMQWEERRPTKDNRAGSLKAARRAEVKAKVRVYAAQRLLTIAETDLTGRLLIIGAQCDVCGRQSVDQSEFQTRCNMTQPTGQRCDGCIVGVGATLPDASQSPPEARTEVSEGIVCSGKGLAFSRL